MSNTYIVSTSDGYETWGMKGFSDPSLAHLEGCKRSQYDSGRDHTRVQIDNNGKTVLHLNYTCGGYTSDWYPPYVDNED